MIVNGTESDSYSSWDMVYLYNMQDVVIEDVDVYDMVHGYYSARLFEIYYADSLTMSNILVTRTIDEDEESVSNTSISVLYCDDGDGMCTT